MIDVSSTHADKTEALLFEKMSEYLKPRRKDKHRLHMSLCTHNALHIRQLEHLWKLTDIPDLIYQKRYIYFNTTEKK